MNDFGRRYNGPPLVQTSQSPREGEMIIECTNCHSIRRIEIGDGFGGVHHFCLGCNSCNTPTTGNELKDVLEKVTSPEESSDE